MEISKRTSIFPLLIVLGISTSDTVRELHQPVSYIVDEEMGNSGYPVEEYRLNMANVLIFDLTPCYDHMGNMGPTAIFLDENRNEVFAFLTTGGKLQLWCCFGDQLAEVSTPGLAVCQTKASYWISWFDGVIALGKDRNYGVNEIFTYDTISGNSLSLDSVLYLHLKSYHTKAKFDIYYRKLFS